MNQDTITFLPVTLCSHLLKRLLLFYGKQRIRQISVKLRDYKYQITSSLCLGNREGQLHDAEQIRAAELNAAKSLRNLYNGNSP